jgi:hypothetical protein
MAGYFDEVLEIGETLNSRYDDLKSGRVKPIDGVLQPDLGADPTREPITAWERSEPTGNHLAYSQHAPPNPALFLASTQRLRASSPAHWPEQAL